MNFNMFGFRMNLNYCTHSITDTTALLKLHCFFYYVFNVIDDFFFSSTLIFAKKKKKKFKVIILHFLSKNILLILRSFLFLLNPILRLFPHISQ